MTADSPPYKRCDPPVPVVVHIDGEDEPYPGMVEGWRGDRVKVSWSSRAGLTHTGWLPASSVTRITELLQDVGPIEPDAT